MGFWTYMLILVLLTPLTMVVLGAIFLYRPPREINHIFGYRTTMSMKSKETWDFAHKMMGKLWLILGASSIPFMVVPMLFVMNKSENTISVLAIILFVISLVPLLVPIIPVEIALSRNFDKNGNIKEPKD